MIRAGPASTVPMRLILLINSKSGTGGARARAGKIAHALTTAGHDCDHLDVADPPDAALAKFRRADAAIVVGGDGSVHHALPMLVDTGVPVYHAPTGTENLFAREFGMSRRSRAICAAAEAARITRCDVAVCARADAPPRPFAIMLSIGPDAGVMRRMAAARRGPITHLSYAGPVIRETFAPSLAPMTVEADDKTVVDNRPGVLIVANARQYALRIDPAWEARTDDGLLDLVFLPASSSLAMTAAFLAARFRVATPGSVRVRAADIRIQAPDAPVQIDGESVLSADRLHITVQPRALAILSPVDPGHAPAASLPLGSPVRGE